MLRFKHFYIVLVLFAALAVGSIVSRVPSIETSAGAQERSVQKWETMVVRGGSTPEGLQGGINMRGEEGWELVDVIETKQGFVAFLKRPK